MDVNPLTGHAASQRQPIVFDDWTSRLQSICGRFQPMSVAHRSDKRLGPATRWFLNHLIEINRASKHGIK